MKNRVQSLLIWSLLAGVVGCSTESADTAAADKATADARVEAADARVDAADARVDAANARAKAAVNTAPKTPAAPAAPAKPTRTRVVIPSGTQLRVALIDGLDSETNSAGDHFLASLAESVVVDGVTLLPKGTKVRGRVVDVEGAGRVKGVASIRLALTDIMQGDRMVAIETNTFSASADSSKKRDAGIVAGGAGVGAIIGAITGGKKGAGVGAVVGGGGGTGVVLATKGEQIHYGPETRLNFTLSDSVEM